MPFIHVNSQHKWLTFMSYLSSCYISLRTGVCVLYVPFSLRHLETHSSGPLFPLAMLHVLVSVGPSRHLI